VVKQANLAYRRISSRLAISSPDEFLVNKTVILCVRLQRIANVFYRLKLENCIPLTPVGALVDESLSTVPIVSHSVNFHLLRILLECLSPALSYCPLPLVPPSGKGKGKGKGKRRFV